MITPTHALIVPAFAPCYHGYMIEKITQAAFIRFAGVGAISTLLDFAVYNILLRLHVNVYIAGAIGFFAGFSNGYFMNSRYVFAKNSRTMYVKYLTTSLIGLVLTEIILRIMHGELGLSQNGAKLIAVVVVFFWNYGVSKYWAFK